MVATYGDRSIRSARMEVQLPSVIALKVGLCLIFSLAVTVPCVVCTF